MKAVLNLTQFEYRVAEVYSTIRICRMTHAEAIAEVKRLITDEAYRKYANGRHVYSVWTRGFVSGLDRAHYNALWREVEFCYLVDGVLYSTHKTSTHRLTEEFYARGEGHLLSKAEGRHYWLGTDKPY